MSLRRVLPGLVLLVLTGGAFAVWALYEARRQSSDIEATLVAQASILAGSLGPGLGAAANAVRELDEIVVWKLLDNARLLAELRAAKAGSAQALASIVEANGLDSVVFFDASGQAQEWVGERIAPELAGEITDILAGRTEELILGSTSELGIDHISVAVGIPGGGAVLVRIHASAARTFARRLGVASLLESLVRSSGVLYLSYREEPGGLLAEAAWDDGQVPGAPGPGPRLRTVRGRSAFEVEVPIQVPAGRSGNLRVGLDGVSLERAAAAATRRTLLVGIVLAGFGLAGTGFAMVSRLRTREREEAARRLAESELARRRSERLAAAGALTAGLAHEVRSPLNAIGLAAQRVQRKHPDGGECNEFAARIRGEVQRLEGVLREFLDFARPVSDLREPVELEGVVGEVMELLGAEAEERGVRLSPVEGTATVRADREAIRRATINLVRNAVQASNGGGRVGVKIVRAGDHTDLRVSDEGEGFDPALEDRAFDAFVTTRPSGTGLGLSMVRRVAEEHGGSCRLANRSTGGAEVTLRLPGDAASEP